jgi:Leucine-rich repeat (LRR) protein
MSLAEIVTIELGTVLAKSVLKVWTKDSVILQDISSSLIDLLKARTSDALAQRRGQRQFEIIGERIADNLLPFFEVEGAHLEEEGRTAVVLAVAEALSKSEFSSRLLAQSNLDQAALAQHILASHPTATQYFNETETSFYQLIITKSCEYIIDIASQLPAFTEHTFAEVLKREDQLIAKTDQILQGIHRLQELQNSTTEAGRFEVEYRLAILRKLDILHLFGADVSTANRRHSLSSAYITLSVEQQLPSITKQGHRTRTKSTKGTNGSQDSPIKNVVPVDKALADSSLLLIRGQAGSGKTTLLQWIAVSSAMRSFDAYLTSWNNTIPFYIRLRQCLGSSLPAPETFPRLVAPAIADTMPKGWVHKQLNLGRAIILVDGLDEVPASQRGEVRVWLKELIESYPKSRFFLTSRPHAVEEGWVERDGFNSVELQPMELLDIYSFIMHWHKAVREELYDDDEKAELEFFAQSLKQNVKNNRSIRSLATNPLLCAMLCALNRDRRQQLPVDRIELYEACCYLLLERRDKERRIELDDYPALNYRQKRHLLEDLAYWMIKNGWSEVPTQIADTRFSWRLKTMQAVSQNISGSDVRRLFVERSGIIREPIIGRIDFTHRTFQEFLSVSAATDEMDTGLLIANAHNSQWQEVIILTVGFAPKQMREELIKGIIARGDKEEEHRYQLHFLAVSCLETSLDLDQEIKTEIEKRLSQLVPPMDMTDANALASAGEVAVKYLSRGDYTPTILAACIRALSLIGGEAALEMLEEYAQDKDPIVVDELFKSWDFFDRGTYANRILFHVVRNQQNLSLVSLSSLDGIQNFKSIEALNLHQCEEVKDFTPLYSLKQLVSLRISYSPNLKTLNLANFKNLTSLTLSGCINLKSVNFTGTERLTSLTIYACDKLSDISSLSNLTQLKVLYIIGCPEIKDLEPLAGLTQLTSLDMSYCPQISDLQPLSNLTQLKWLSLSKCFGVRDLGPLKGLAQLVILKLLHCYQIKDLSPLAGLTKLDSLFLSNCSNLVPLKSLAQLSLLFLRECPDLSDLLPLADLTQLTTLVLSHCPQVSKISPLANLSRLNFLHLSDSCLKDLTPLAGLTQLRTLALVFCPEIDDLSPLKHLTKLKIYNIK